jgi:hypothetical protein
MKTTYTRAIKVFGFWVILLSSQKDHPKAVSQFSSLSRKAANVWADMNEPLPSAYQLNSTAGAAVWRARGGV